MTLMVIQFWCNTLLGITFDANRCKCHANICRWSSSPSFCSSHSVCWGCHGLRGLGKPPIGTFGVWNIKMKVKDVERLIMVFPLSYFHVSQERSKHSTQMYTMYMGYGHPVSWIFTHHVFISLIPVSGLLTIPRYEYINQHMYSLRPVATCATTSRCEEKGRCP